MIAIEAMTADRVITIGESCWNIGAGYSCTKVVHVLSGSIHLQVAGWVLLIDLLQVLGSGAETVQCVQHMITPLCVCFKAQRTRGAGPLRVGRPTHETHGRGSTVVWLAWRGDAPDHGRRSREERVGTGGRAAGDIGRHSR